MAIKEGMHTFTARLASFEEERHGGKRRASSIKKRPTSTRAWPHETPTPEQLAKAGFYYDPTPDSSDSVTCYICNKALNGWDPADDPALEHFSHVPECAWAISLNIERATQSKEMTLADPLSEELVAARTTTFGSLWPHAGKRGWKCTVAKMVDAGWSLVPAPEGGDDCVKCFYCGISLDGWEPKDDPLDEHVRRSPDCKFFELKEQFAAQRKPTKTKRTRTSRVSKASRLSTQSNMTTVSEGVSFTLLDGEAEEGDTMMTAASTVSKAAKRSKAAPKAKAAPKGRKGTRQEPVAESLPEEQMKGVVEEDAAVLTPPQSPVEKPKKRAASKGKKAKVSIQASHVVVDDDSEVALPRKTARATSKKKADTPAVDSKEEDTDASALPEKQVQRPKRGVKRTSDGIAKSEGLVMLESSAVELENAQIEEMEPQPKPKSKARGKAKASTVVRHPDVAEETVEPEPKAKRQPKKASVQPAEPIKETAEEIAAPKTTKVSKPRAKAAPIEILDEETQPEVKPGAPTAPVSYKQSRETHETKKASVKTQPSPPASSPQSSDAENHLPSSRISLASRPSLTAFPEPPSAHKPTITAPAPPIFAAPISTPPQSPSKRNLITKGITSTLPWTAIDLEKAFPLSPSSDADTQAALAGLLPNGQSELLTSPEKRMTVEEWVLWNAANAEERMRNQCERMVKRFEDEGGRAMRVLEGIECV